MNTSRASASRKNYPNLAERRASALELARVSCLSRREQTPAGTAVSLHVWSQAFATSPVLAPL
jgi:hypothetical protein